MHDLALRLFPVGGCPFNRMVKLALRPLPVGGCPCGRMIAVAPANIREQGLSIAPSRHTRLDRVSMETRAQTRRLGRG